MARPGYFAVDSLANVHVLLVDDDRASRDGLLAILRYCGAFVTIADTGGEALRFLALMRPDVVVIALPGRHRRYISLISALQARKADGAGLPIIIVVDADDTPDLGVTVTLILRRPLRAWDFCRALAEVRLSHGT